MLCITHWGAVTIPTDVIMQNLCQSASGSSSIWTFCFHAFPDRINQYFLFQISSFADISHSQHFIYAACCTILTYKTFHSSQTSAAFFCNCNDFPLVWPVLMSQIPSLAMPSVSESVAGAVKYCSHALPGIFHQGGWLVSGTARSFLHPFS